MAQYWTDFSEYTVGVAPTGWTLRDGDGTYEIRVVDESDSIYSSNFVESLSGGQAVRLPQPSVSTSVIHGWSWDAAGTPSEFDIIAKVGQSSSVSNNWSHVFGRSSFDWSASTVSDTVLRTRVNGDATDYLHEQTITTGTFYFVRYRAADGRIQSAFSTTLADITGETPAAGWAHDVVDPSAATTGGAGLGRRERFGSAFYDWIGIGTGGDAAPTSAPTSVAVPTNFTFTADGLQLDGAWSAVSGTTVTYDWEVERDDAGTWVAFDSANTATLAFQVTTGVAYSTTYRARVRADDDGVKSDWTDHTSLTTVADSLAISGTQSEAVTLTWTEATSPYDIRRDGVTIIVSGLTVTTYTDTDVTAGTTYSYEVRSDGGAWSSPTSVAVVEGGGGVFFLKRVGSAWTT